MIQILQRLWLNTFISMGVESRKTCSPLEQALLNYSIQHEKLTLNFKVTANASGQHLPISLYLRYHLALIAAIHHSVTILVTLIVAKS